MYRNIMWTWSTSVSSVDHLLWKSSRQRVEQQDEEQHCDQEEQGEDNVFLVVLPHQVEETFERIDEPRERSVRAAGVRGERGEQNYFIW